MAISPDTKNLWVGTNGGLAEVEPTEARVLRTALVAGLLNNEVWWHQSVYLA